MTRIGAICLGTIGVWIVIELAVQFGHYGHSCVGGAGAQRGLYRAARGWAGLGWELRAVAR